MIHLAQSPRTTRFMQESRAGSFLSRKYVAGKSPDEAITTAGDLLSVQGIHSSLFYLGEYVDSQELVDLNIKNKLAIAEALGTTDFDVHISVDPTQIGHSVDPSKVLENANRIVTTIKQLTGNRSGVNCMMIDMEDDSVVDATIALHDQLKQEGFPVALTLQAYLKRTTTDLQKQIDAGSRVRLVKGAFVGNPDIAYSNQPDIKANYYQLVEQMLAERSKEAGFYPIIATHDDKIHRFAIDRAAEAGWKQGEYEFEMLLGVRSDVAKALAERGERVRVYVPFGRDWWPYAVRRIGENPRNALLLARSLFN